MARSSWIIAIALGSLFAATAPSSSLAADAAPPAPSLDKAQLKRYRAIMGEAVRAAKKGKHAQAIAAYDRALAIKPNDQAALTDQGWSAFLLGTLDRAETITRKALAVDGENRRKAAASYNLGRILQQRGDRPGAIAAYVQSLEWRPTRTVRERLATLDPAKAAQMDPLKPVPMLGPFVKPPENFCQTSNRRYPELCVDRPSGAHVKGIAPPYSDVLWFRADETRCHLAFKLIQGWFVDAKGDDCPDDVAIDWEVVDLGISDLVPGGSPEVVFRTNTRNYDLYANEEGFAKRSLKDCEARMMACGVPATGTPSCVYLPTGKGDSCSIFGHDDWTWQLQPVFSADGQVEVKATGSPDGDARLYMGRRPLAFP
jgi:tetratricopeptide (TPR) repeat protein